MEFTFQVRSKSLTFSLRKLSTSSFILNFSECMVSARERIHGQTISTVLTRRCVDAQTNTQTEWILYFIDYPISNEIHKHNSLKPVQRI